MRQVTTSRTMPAINDQTGGHDTAAGQIRPRRPIRPAKCVMPAWLPGSLNDFVDLVIPELQRRQLFRMEYEGVMLRDNLGLPRPANRWHAVPEPAE
jgi:hypothetical protein